MERGKDGERGIERVRYGDREGGGMKREREGWRERDGWRVREKREKKGNSH